MMMMRRIGCAILLAAAAVMLLPDRAEAQTPRAFGRAWGTAASYRDWNRFYHYPYVFYPQNFWTGEYYRSSDSLYYRYPSEMRIPVYNKKWYNYYPTCRLYHHGHHFNLDVF